MSFMRQWHKKYLIMLMLVLGLAGSVFFFPLQMDDQSSCCYERMFGGNENCTCRKEANDQSQHELAMNATGENAAGMHQHGSELLDSYLHHYAFPWWISVGLLAAGCFLWIREKDKRQKTKDKRQKN